jgi:hypothetical protein
MASVSGAEWVSAVSTFVATVAAVFAGWVAHRAHRAAADDRDRSEAEGVQVWLAFDASTQSPRLVLINAGSGPVYEVSVGVSMRGEHLRAPSAGGAWNVLPPGTYATERTIPYRWSFPEPVRDLTVLSPYMRSENDLVQWVEFTDTHRRRWRRGVDGALTKIQRHQPVMGAGA